MDDLSSLDWDASQSKTNGGSFNALRPNNSGLNGQTGQSSRQPSPLAGNMNRAPTNGTSSAPKHDSFAGLLGPSVKKGDGLSLQERQKQLLEERARQGGNLPGTSTASTGDPYSSNDPSFWEGFGSGRSTPAARGSAGPTPPIQADDDLLAAFSASAPVDSSSHYPPAQAASSDSSRTHSFKRAPSQPSRVQDDDPFGLDSFASRQQQRRVERQELAEDDDDILGLLGKPVQQQRPMEVPARPPQREPTPKSQSEHPQNKAVAELVDMGFPADKARAALERTSDGMDVQAAVSWLLTSAHEEAKAKAKPSGRDDVTEQERSRSRPASNDGRPLEKEVVQYASQISSSVLKTANSLWKTSQKRVQKVYAEYQQESSSNQPRWMRSEIQEQEERAGDATNEAMLLDTPRESLQRPTKREDVPLATRGRSNFESRQEMFADKSRPLQRPTQSQPRPAERLRQTVEEESRQAYVSPARRRRPAAEPTASAPSPVPSPVPSAAAPSDSLDIFSDMPAPSQPSRTATPKASTPATRPKATARAAPPLSASALASSTQHRISGSEAFKRGDYGEATARYSAALQGIPAQHPITIVILSNRALTQLKTGDAKASIVDADAVLAIIGPSHGEDESISLGNGEPDKPMKEFYGKALMRKAEALEHLEKWQDAASIWRVAVEAGVGGSVSIQGRNRCERAGAPAQPKPAPRKPAPAKPTPRRPTPAPSSTNKSEPSDAVNRLRAANAAAAAASDEAFALNDAVTVKLGAWKDGKEGNLRALLASLDTVLWEGANWAKVGMSDLVMPNKVKISYMKAIARVHPDKIASDATVEQRMVSASVFAVLNEAWDKFKRDNNM